MDNIEMVNNDILLLLSALNSNETGYLTGDFCNLLLPGIELLVGLLYTASRLIALINRLKRNTKNGWQVLK